MFYYTADDGGIVRWGRQPFGLSGGPAPTGFETRHRFATENHQFILWYSRGVVGGTPVVPTGFETRHRFANENHQFILWYSRGVVGGTPVVPIGFETRHRFANETHSFILWYSRGRHSITPPTPPAPPPPVPIPTTIGGIGEYAIDIPRIFEKPLPRFKRNMENRDRQDIADIVQTLRQTGFL